MAWYVCPGCKSGMGCFVRGGRTTWDVLSRVANLSPGWQTFVGTLAEKQSLCEYLMNMLRIFCELHCSQ